MWSLNKILSLSLVVLFSVLTAHSAVSQECDLRLSGVVVDEHTGHLMPYVAVYVAELEDGVSTDEYGRFTINGLCPGGLHMEFSHIGCDAVDRFITLRADTSINVVLHHNAQLLKGVDIVGQHDELGQLGAQSVSRAEIDAHSDQDLTAMLTPITGMSAIKNGSAIAKPVYHGLSGNRLTILNNGIAQSGQQWGADHAPEIDPWSADRLSIIQGVSALAHNGPNIGPLVLIEMAPVPIDPHLHGKLNYSLNSNGLGHSINGRMEKGGEWAAWRITLSAKQSGDRQTPDHYLTNTASKQLNAAFLVERKWTSDWRSSLYLSSFNTEIGILRGSHIGNLNDLKGAFERAQPFYTEESSDYSIDNPKQSVNHWLLKFSNKLERSYGRYEFTYAGQYNARREFDVRRGGRDELPALDLDQFDQLFSATLRARTDSAFSWRAGIQYRMTQNTNDPLTGILPLVPDYLSQQGAAFLMGKWEVKKWQMAAGTRLDIKNIFALPISRSLPRVVNRTDLWYQTPSAVMTLRHDFTEEFKVEGEIGYRERSPEVNELFSNGLHQGVSGIEEGDEGLENEAVIQSRLSSTYHIHERYFIELSAFNNQFKDFIYLVPQEALRLTIRGAFPLFSYQQVDANIQGADLNFGAELGNRWRLRTGLSLLKGKETKSDLALIGIPSSTVSASIHYEVEEYVGLQDVRANVTYSHVTTRGDLLTDNVNFPDRAEDSPLLGQDFTAPPVAYNLVDFDLNFSKRIAKQDLDFGLRINNVLNTRYRDYLDRQRYFADAVGRDVRLRIGWKF